MFLYIDFNLDVIIPAWFVQTWHCCESNAQIDNESKNDVWLVETRQYLGFVFIFILTCWEWEFYCDSDIKCLCYCLHRKHLHTVLVNYYIRTTVLICTAVLSHFPWQWKASCCIIRATDAYFRCWNWGIYYYYFIFWPWCY